VRGDHGRDGERGYIYVHGWERFQHYKRRRPTWIKSYVDLLSNEDYLALPPGARGLLHDLWLLTAELGAGRVPASSYYLARVLLIRNAADARWLRANIKRLNDAGFLEVRASKALAREDIPANPETETEAEEEREVKTATAVLTAVTERNDQEHNSDKPPHPVADPIACQRCDATGWIEDAAGDAARCLECDGRGATTRSGAAC
jgi:hypothetical protein